MNTLRTSSDTEMVAAVGHDTVALYGEFMASTDDYVERQIHQCIEEASNHTWTF